MKEDTFLTKLNYQKSNFEPMTKQNKANNITQNFTTNIQISENMSNLNKEVNLPKIRSQKAEKIEQREVNNNNNNQNFNFQFKDDENLETRKIVR